MKISKNEEEKDKAIKEILSQNEFWKLPFEMVTTAMKTSKDETEREKAASEILSQNEFWKLPDSIVTTAMKLSKNETEREKAATLILSQNEFWKLPHEMVTTAMKISKNETEREKAASEILSQKDFGNLPNQIVSMAMKISKNEKLKKNQAIYFLQNWQNENWLIVFQSLKCFAYEKYYPSFVTKVVNTVIHDYFQNAVYSKNDPKRKFYNMYNSLLNLPFHNIPLWKEKTIYLIENWERYDRNFITNVIYSYREYPLMIIGVCRTILENWKAEIKENIYQIYGVPKHGDHIRLSMGHPNKELRKLIKKTSKEIIHYAENKEIEIPPYLQLIAKKIVIDNEFPEWKLDKNDE
jgi:spore coat protein CotF